MSEKTCEYVAKWKYDEDRDMIDFEIQSKHIDKWTGIGFSETPQMVRRWSIVSIMCQVLQ